MLIDCFVMKDIFHNLSFLQNSKRLKMKQKTFQLRNIISKEVAGIRGVARMADKARAAEAGEIGAYKFGQDSQQDTRILSFLGISADIFQEGAVRITNDVELGAWVLDNCNRSDEEIKTFNRQLMAWCRKHPPTNLFTKRRRELLAKEEKQGTFWDWIYILLLFTDC